MMSLNQVKSNCEAIAKFCNSDTLEWKNENKKTELRNSEILLNI